MRSSLLISCTLLIASSLCLAQTGPEKGGHEVQIWAAGGHSVSGGRASTGVFNAGLRYGWILTGPHLSGLLRGRFEYAVDAVPVFLVFQPANTAYGVSFDPLGLKWNFDTGRRVAPYFDMDGGLLLTSSNVPSGISRVNFASGPGVGANFGHGKAHWSLEVRWLHISDAGLTPDNPGINILEARVGLGWFHHKE